MFFEDSVEVNAVVDDCRTETRAVEIRLEVLLECLAAHAQVRHCRLRVEAALDGHDYPRCSAAATLPMKRFSMWTK